MKAIITIGVSASGKSTWASQFIAEQASKNIVWQRIERDCIRKQILMLKTNKEWSWDAWNWKWEKDVNDMVNSMIEKAANENVNLICSDTNLNKKFRLQLIAKVVEFGFSVEFKTFEVTFEEAVKRDNARPNGVGASVIAKQFEDWNSHFVVQYEPDESLPKAVIVDIDGTLAHMNHGRGPFDWDKVEQDKLDREIADIVNGLRDQGYSIVVLSGRDGICKPQTDKWLTDNEVFYSDFFMREAGDMRKDSKIKAEIFWNKVSPKYNVRMVIDDRPQVTRMWRSIGLKVIQVGNPYIEF